MPDFTPNAPAARRSRKPPASRQILVCGRLVPADQPVLRADDRGVLYGDGAFETIRVVDGRPRHLERHRVRLGQTLDALGIDRAPLDALGADLGRLLTANELLGGEAIARVTITRGTAPGPRPAPGPPTIIITARPLPHRFTARRAGVHLRTVSGLVRALPRWKTVCYLPGVLALAAVEPQEEPLLVDTDGHALECATANLFVSTGQGLRTPPDDGSILPGVARGLVIEGASSEGLPVECARIPIDALGARPMLITNALLPVAPVATLDGAPLPPPDRALLKRLRRWLD